jgi:glucose-6-phosphate isomerase
MKTHRSDGALPPLGGLFEADPARLSRLTFEVAGIYFDWSKTHLDAAAIVEGIERAGAMGFAERRDALFSGDVVNPSEGRAATHIAERGSGSADAVDLAHARRLRMRALVDAIEAGAFGTLSAILHIGIGGSVLGPALLVDSLGRNRAGPTVRFLSNIDGQAFSEATEGLDPATTLVIAASKTFTTIETMANLGSAIDWLKAGDVADPHGRVIAVTAAPEAALDAGIDESRILMFDDGVGGRYSIWSAVGLPAALALGWDAFEALLEGAAEMDRHFRLAEADKNVPLIAAIADRLYVAAGSQSRAVFPYDERLRLLVPYLQQLEMESNGKSVSADGKPLEGSSAPVTWGGTGTDAQHAVFQLLHQGTLTVPVEFVAASEAAQGADEGRHAQLLFSAIAQGAALMAGRTDADSARSNPGGRPSATILLDQLDARTLGALIAFYEHRTFANAVLIGNNPFDQFGVELGKDIARTMTEEPDNMTLDASSRALLERAGL